MRSGGLTFLVILSVAGCGLPYATRDMAVSPRSVSDSYGPAPLVDWDYYQRGVGSTVQVPAFILGRQAICGVGGVSLTCARSRIPSSSASGSF